jgi:hypothetical protein
MTTYQPALNNQGASQATAQTVGQEFIKIPTSTGNCSIYPEVRQDRVETVEGKIIELQAQLKLTNLLGTTQFAPKQIPDYYKDILDLKTVGDKAYAEGVSSVKRNFLESNSKWYNRKVTEGNRRRDAAIAQHLDLCKRAVNNEATEIATELAKIENLYLQEQAKSLTPVGSGASNTQDLTIYYIVGGVLLLGIGFMIYKISQK